MTALLRDEAEQRLKTLDGWSLKENALCKEYAFGNFMDAVAFVDRLAPRADAAHHHPDISINYTWVTLSYSTHSQGGLTDKDFEGAAMADRLVTSNRSASASRR